MSGRSSAAPVLIGVLCAAVAAGASPAQDGPAFDCARAEGAVETLICTEAGLAALDRRMAERFGKAMEAARGLDAGAEAAVNELRAYQRGWISGRNDCWKAEDTRACVEDAYLVRENELVALWLLEEPMARTRWVCAGNPANEVGVWFFDTERPSIRIEYGDSVDAGSLAPAASGARYTARFGREFWEKGDMAQFVWDEGDPMTCEKVSG